MLKNFDEVIYLMTIASTAKVNQCLNSVEWEQRAVINALNNSDLNVDGISSVLNGRNLETVKFYCAVKFRANEIPGIISPCFCCLYVEVTYDQQADKRSFSVAYGPRGMLSIADYETIYDVDYLHNEFSKKEPALDINQFVSIDFDFRRICKQLGVETVSCVDTI